jgi:hypothetical protein
VRGGRAVSTRSLPRGFVGDAAQLDEGVDRVASIGSDAVAAADPTTQVGGLRMASITSVEFAANDGGLSDAATVRLLVHSQSPDDADASIGEAGGRRQGASRMIDSDGKEVSR